MCFFTLKSHKVAPHSNKSTITAHLLFQIYTCAFHFHLVMLPTLCGTQSRFTSKLTKQWISRLVSSSPLVRISSIIQDIQLDTKISSFDFPFFFSLFRKFQPPSFAALPSASLWLGTGHQRYPSRGRWQPKVPRCGWRCEKRRQQRTAAANSAPSPTLPWSLGKFCGHDSGRGAPVRYGHQTYHGTVI